MHTDPITDRILLTARRLGPLPRRVQPFPDERIDSYLNRLDHTNGLRYGTIEHLARTNDHGYLSVLSQLAGLSTDTLIRSMPDLRSSADLAAFPDLQGRVWPKRAHHRTACHLCALQHGARPDVTGDVSIWARHHDLVCYRHRRWIGPRLGSASQFSIGNETAIWAAAKTHRKFVEKHGPLRTSNLYFDALHIIDRWFGWRLELPDAQRLFAKLHAQHEQKRSADIWTAAYYPTTIALLRIMLDLHGARYSPPLAMTLVESARDRVAHDVTAGYHPTGWHDPFLQWLNTQPSPYDESGHTEVLQ
jgi:hypothetical protein